MSADTVFAEGMMQHFRNPRQFKRKNFSVVQSSEI